MNNQCSHVLIWVEDLHQAVDNYRKAGFSVHYATAQHKAKHAHIWFEEGPIIELLTTPKNARWFKWPIDLLAGKGAGDRMTRWPAKGEGFCDIAMVTNDRHLETNLLQLHQDGVAMGRPVCWTRKRPDGQKTRFRFVYPTNARLPFLVTPYDPVQHPPQVKHANGALRLRRVNLGVQEEDRQAVMQLLAGDVCCQLHEAAETSVISIELEGLNETPKPSLMHGARILPAQGKGEENPQMVMFQKEALC